MNLHAAESPERRWRETWTYASAEVNPDDEWGVNFVMGDVPVGSYVLKTRIDGRLYTEEVTVRDGSTSFVALGAEN